MMEKSLMSLRIPVLLTIAVAAIGSAASGANAAGRPLSQRQVPAPLPAAATRAWHSVRPGPHMFYGTLAAVRGGVIMLRLRSGRSIVVDATAAIAHGDYSAPLFPGKMVSVDGNVIGATFRATHVFRMSNLANLPRDH
jgi:hypothetical protein